MTLEFTEEERDAMIVQLGFRIDGFKQEVSDCKDFNRIREIIEFIKPLESAYSKLVASHGFRLG